ncbi:PrsW family intramembrane metalloprotease [Halosimplex litoreum]|uniref:PrsW family intramembrane metalloprotease n=1 Tax=Halosimplex litoreum TaxID=1198301 RepID=A0A7T3FW78_9EURY|nr:PrsW family glutamic-type intramembrane protease [Halosimplex litoreum]QPV61894.1 PrsW family intramembrane metalloprotease [Halosimplex litoreum]
MSESRDPVEARADGERDLYEVSTWEPRSLLDKLSVFVYGTGVSALRLFVVVLALVILGVQVILGGLGAVANPVIGTFTLLSAVPALGLAAYVWYADVTSSEPLELLVGTFALGVLFAGFAGVVNTVVNVSLESLGLMFWGTQILYFFLVVGPVEETVKLLAVRLYAYRTPEFDAVVDGAVYGAMAGLGFATIENAIYIAGQTQGVADTFNLVVTGTGITAVRALAGPGHVIYSAFAGYYLGLAKFNRDRAGPIVVKGLLIATVVHALYNTLSGFVPGLVAGVTGIPWFVAFFGFVILYDGIFGLLLIRKISRYRRAYHESTDEAPDGERADMTEFDG